VRVDGSLIFNTVPPQIDAALAGLGVVLLPEDDLQSYLDKGITIRFIAYPRAGMNSMIARNMASIWCADDKPAALTRAMKGDGLPEKQPT
ncbi:hypothetical protein ACPXAZ_24965, partial [Escherichia coli]